MSKTIAQFRADIERRAAEQVRINEVAEASGLRVAEEVIRQSATLAMAEFPQYHGKFGQADWVLGRATLRCEGKGGLSAEPGDVVLMRHRPGLGFSAGETSFWSVRRQIECVVSCGIEPIVGWSEFFRASRAS